MVLIDIDSGQFYYRGTKDGGVIDEGDEEDEVDLDDVLPQHYPWEKNVNDRCSWEDAALVDIQEETNDDDDDEDSSYQGARHVPWNGHHARRESFEDETADPILEPFPTSTGAGGTAVAWGVKGDWRGGYYYLASRRHHRRTCLLALLLVVAVTAVTVLGVVGVRGGAGPTAMGNDTTTTASNSTTTSSNAFESDLELGAAEPSIAPVGPTVVAEGSSPQPSPPPTATVVEKATDPPSLPPTPSPTTPLPSTVAPTETDPCPIEAAAIRECFAQQGNNDSSTTASDSILEATVAQAACESCVLKAVGPVYSIGSNLCQDDDQGIRTDVCTALWSNDCQCGACAASVEEYLSCRSNCTVDCNSGSDAGGATPTVASSPTPTPPFASSLSPTVPLRCPDEDTAFNTCADSSSNSNGGGSDECLFCLLSYWPATPSGTAECLTVEDATCLGLSSCKCGSQCSAEFVGLVGCLTGCPTFACP